MATPRKLPSGMYRCQVYDYTDGNGKRHYRSFTDQNKKICQLMAADFAANKKRRSQGNLTVSEAIEEYVKVKEKVLSPATIRGYKVMQRNHFKYIDHIQIRSLTNEDVQRWVNSLTKRLSRKSVSNAYGLLVAVVGMFAPEIRFKVKLPQREQPDLYVPSDSDIKELLRMIAGTELEKAVLLAAFGPLRRGEICALTSDDIKGNMITVRKSMVRDSENKWIIKEPKTFSSYRTVHMPDFVMEKIRDIKGPIISVKPDTLTMQFERIFKDSNIPKFRFHDLRHYSASIMHAIGIPDQYIMQRGGWSTDGIMKAVYRNTIDEQTARMNVKINQYFNDISHDMQHDD